MIIRRNGVDASVFPDLEANKEGGNIVAKSGKNEVFGLDRHGELHLGWVLRWPDCVPAATGFRLRHDHPGPLREGNLEVSGIKNC